MTVDDTLGALAASAVHPGMEAIGPGVFARIDAEARIGRQARRGMLVAIGTAAIAGAAGAAIPAGAPPAAPLMPTPLAPSTLLGGGE